jgi:hypothetical protein
LLLQILSHSGNIENGVDAKWAKESRVPNARALQKSRGIDCTGGEDDLLSYIDLIILASIIGLLELDTMRES